jgi:protein-S-isoprenylcysteine O-methyltransferase Ste14
MSYKTLSVIATIVLVVAVVTLVLTRGLFSVSPVVIVIQILAACLMIWARVTFGLRSFHAAANPTKGGLVTTGPYHYIRHPIYSAVLIFCSAGVIANLSVVHVLLGVVIVAGTATRILCEERLVLEKYPEYADYAKKTRRIIPHVI